MEERKFKCYQIQKNVYCLKTKYYEANTPFVIINVLTEQVVNRFTLFIFAKMGHVKALPWSSARYLIEYFEPLPGAPAQQLSAASFSGSRGV